MITKCFNLTLGDLWTDGEISENFLIYGKENNSEENEFDGLYYYGSVSSLYDKYKDCPVYGVDYQYGQVILKQKGM